MNWVPIIIGVYTFIVFVVGAVYGMWKWRQITEKNDGL